MLTDEVWRYIAFLVVSFIVGWVLRPYFTKRSEQQAEYDAIMSNLDTIKAKVDATERTAAEIKAEVDQRGWRERKRLTLGRAHLEEFLAMLYAFRDECLRHGHEAIDEEKKLLTDMGPINRCQALASLYFPDMRQQVRAMLSLFLQIRMDAVQVNAKWRVFGIQRQGLDPVKMRELRSVLDAETIPLRTAHTENYKKILQQVMALEEAVITAVAKYVP